jgi:PAS domain S-box-containing protein
MSIAQYNPISMTDAVGASKLEELILLANALPMLIARINEEGCHCYNNQAYDDWFGLAPQGHYGKRLPELLGEKAYDEIHGRVQKAFAGEKQVFDSTLRHRDGSNRHVRVSYIPCVSALGKTEGIYIMTLDLTEYQQSQAEVQRLNAELERRVQERTAQLQATNHELEAFCYSVSHDLRAPLRSVRGFTEVLLEQYATQLDLRGQDFLRRVRDASSQMDKLVDDLLRLSRVSRSEIQCQDVHLSRLAEEIIAELKKAEPSRNVEVSLEPGLQGRGDERLLRLVLDNLLRNAWKFTSKRPDARIEFGCRKEGDPAFFVRDNGVGFDMIYENRLFGVFQRLHSASDYPGSGVGLAIVQRVINRHGGRVWAEGAVNSGATFHFTLPTNCVP